jgi:hypothetical protein
VTAEALLHELHNRGVQLFPEGDRIRYRAPRGALTPELKARLSEQKGEVLSVLQRQGELLESAPALEVRQQIGAVRIASPRFGEVWLCLDPCLAGQLRAEESQRTDPRPVLTTADLAHLECKPPQMVEAILNTLTAFPGARVLQ